MGGPIGDKLIAQYGGASRTSLPQWAQELTNKQKNGRDIYGQELKQEIGWFISKLETAPPKIRKIVLDMLLLRCGPNPGAQSEPETTARSRYAVQIFDTR